jgi:hypothetical protein
MGSISRLDSHLQDQTGIGYDIAVITSVRLRIKHIQLVTKHIILVSVVGIEKALV